MNEEIDVQFITEPDVVGYGRIVYNGRYFGLPMEVIEDYKQLKENENAGSSSETNG